MPPFKNPPVGVSTHNLLFGEPGRDRTCDTRIKSLIHAFLHLLLSLINSYHLSWFNAVFRAFGLLTSTFQLSSVRQSLREYCGNGKIQAEQANLAWNARTLIVIFLVPTY